MVESPLDCREVQLSILKEISPRCSLEGMILKLKLQYSGHLMRRVDSLEKTLMLGGIGGRRRRGRQRMRCWMASPTRWTWVLVNSGSWWWTGRPGVLRFMGSQRVGHDWATELDWTELWVHQFSCVWLLVNPRIAARQASLSITNYWSSLKLTSIESMMPSSHLILCHPLLLLPPIPPSIRVFSNESTLCMRWPKYWSFSFSISPSKEHPGLISFNKREKTSKYFFYFLFLIFLVSVCWWQ